MFDDGRPLTDGKEESTILGELITSAIGHQHHILLVGEQSMGRCTPSQVSMVLSAQLICTLRRLGFCQISTAGVLGVLFDTALPQKDATECKVSTRTCCSNRHGFQS